MPDILTHLIGADESLKNLSHNVSSTILANRNIYNLGAQGPDLFFYDRIFPWQKKSTLEPLGTLLHKKHTNDFFIEGADRIKQSFTGEAFDFFEKKEATSDLHKQFAYLAGFLTHYALDIHVHPYIFYFSGHKGGYNHKYFECILDTLMSEVYNTKKMKFYKSSKAIKLSNYDRLVVSEYLSMIIFRTYSKDINHLEIQQTIKDMKNAMAAMFDPKAIKKGGLKVIDQLTKAGGKIATAKFPAVYDKKIDHFNLQHQSWCHPCNDQIIYHTSFLECLEAGISEASQLIMALSKYITHQLTKEDFKELLGNRLYETGLEENLPQTMLYSNAIVDFHKMLKIKGSND